MANEFEQRKVICNHLRLIPLDEVQTVFRLSPSLFSQPCRFRRAVKSASFPPGDAKGACTNSPRCILIGILRTAPDPSATLTRGTSPFRGGKNPRTLPYPLPRAGAENIIIYKGVMYIMKKKITAIFLCVALVAIAIVGASLAYFTDTDEATNTFTVGNVKIDLIESRYHRQGSGGSGDTSIPAPTQTASGMKYVSDDATIYTDEEIKADAANYSAYIGERGKNMVPGRRVAKSPYVINTGANDAYIRIRVMIPTAANNDYVNVHEGGVITNVWCSTSMLSGEFVNTKSGGQANEPYIKKAAVTRDGVTYDVYTFVRVEPLAAGAMTEWNVWNNIGINKDATSADVQKAIDAGAITVTDSTMTLNVLVEADAIQAEGFADADAAWAAYDA